VTRTVCVNRKAGAGPRSSNSGSPNGQRGVKPRRRGEGWVPLNTACRLKARIYCGAKAAQHTVSTTDEINRVKASPPTTTDIQARQGLGEQQPCTVEHSDVSRGTAPY